MGPPPFKQQLNIMDLMTPNESRISTGEKFILVVLYFLVAILGLLSSFWTTNIVWMALLVVPSIFCVILAIYWFRYKTK